MSVPQLFVSTYIDEDVNGQLAVSLRDLGFHAVAAREIGHTSMDDADHLAYAVKHQMMLLTSNRNDFIAIAHEWASVGKSHYGIVIAQQYSKRQFGELLQLSLSLLNQVTADEMLDSVCFLSSFR